MAAEGGGAPRNFATTRWSLILTSTDLGGDDQKARQALAELCRPYWRPIFSFVCRRGHFAEAAQDLNQDFSVMMLAGNWLRHVDLTRGRSRSLVPQSLGSFRNDDAAERHARK